jgi:hypothetical protein
LIKEEFWEKPIGILAESSFNQTNILYRFFLKNTYLHTYFKSDEAPRNKKLRLASVSCDKYLKIWEFEDLNQRPRELLA